MNCLEKLGFEHGIPSHDTLGDVFAAIDTEQFNECFLNWAADLASLIEEDIIAIDRKCLRRSIDKASNRAVISMDRSGLDRIAWSWDRLKLMINSMKLVLSLNFFVAWILRVQ